MLSELTWEEELDSRLDRSGRHGSSSGDSDETGGFRAKSVEGVVHEGVHDVHGSSGDSDIWVDLLEDLVDVEGVGLISSPSPGFGRVSFCLVLWGHFWSVWGIDFWF